MEELKHAPEPFGFFKAEPFGWTDCAETEEGATPLFDKQAVDSLAAQIAELESLRAENLSLKAERDYYLVNVKHSYAEGSELRAKVAEIERQEPVAVAFVGRGGVTLRYLPTLQELATSGAYIPSLKLYASPVISPDVAKLQAELEAEKAAAQNYRLDAIEAGKQRDEVLAALQSIGKITYDAGFNIGGPLEHCPGELSFDESKRLLSMACEYLKDTSKAASRAIASAKGGA